MLAWMTLLSIAICTLSVDSCTQQRLEQCKTHYLKGSANSRQGIPGFSALSRRTTPERGNSLRPLTTCERHATAGKLQQQQGVTAQTIQQQPTKSRSKYPDIRKISQRSPDSRRSTASSKEMGRRELPIDQVKSQSQRRRSGIFASKRPGRPKLPDGQLKTESQRHRRARAQGTIPITPQEKGANVRYALYSTQQRSKWASIAGKASQRRRRERREQWRRLEEQKVPEPIAQEMKEALALKFEERRVAERRKQQSVKRKEVRTRVREQRQAERPPPPTSPTPKSLNQRKKHGGSQKRSRSSEGSARSRSSGSTNDIVKGFEALYNQDIKMEYF